MGENFLTPIVCCWLSYFCGVPHILMTWCTWNFCTWMINLANFVVVRHQSGSLRDVCGPRWSAAAVKLTSQPVQLVGWSGCCVGESWAPTFLLWVSQTGFHHYKPSFHVWHWRINGCLQTCCRSQGCLSVVNLQIGLFVFCWGGGGFIVVWNFMVKTRVMGIIVCEGSQSSGSWSFW